MDKQNEQNGLERIIEESGLEWIEWARKKADWYDPIIARNDEYLGRRNHGKSKEEKDFDEVSTRRNWSW